MKKKYIITLFAFVFLLQGEVKSTPAAGGMQENSVYIVPDLETFLYTISLWDKDRRFPVFIGRNRFTDKFLAAYPGAAVIDTPKAYYVDCDRDTVLKALYASWGPESLYDIKKKITAEDIKARLRKIGATPRGIVLTRMSDRELAGGILLAAYRKQLIDFLDVAVEKVRNEKNEEVIKAFSGADKEKIRNAVIEKIQSWGYEYKGIGRGIDYITLAMHIPYSYSGGMCLDDAINREGPQPADCYAYTGRLVDDNSGMALYQANCAAFLSVHKALLFDRWPADWNYGMAEAQWNFLNFIPAIYPGPGKSNMAAWRSLMAKENPFDIIFVQSSGGPKHWQDGQLNDIPDSPPVIVHFAHSYSAADIHDVNTIAGRWLYNGAYVYLGAIHEPQNRAFQKPAFMSAAIAGGLPLGLAFERKETLTQRYAAPWKLLFVGDPMCTASWAVRTDEAASYTVFQRGFRKLQDMNFTAAENFFEQFLRSFPASDLKETAREYLAKTYLLKFYEYTSQKYPIQKHLSAAFLRNWYCGGPSEASALRESLPYLKDRELKSYYQNLYAVKGANPAAAALLKEEVAALNKTIPFLKEWALIGPFSVRDEEKHPALADPAHLAAGKPITIGNTAYPWNILIADKKTNVLHLRSPGGTDGGAFAYALAVLSSKGNRHALFKITSSSRFVLYINRRKSFDTITAPPPAKGLFRLDVPLRNGLNEILIKTYRPEGDWSFSFSVHSLGGGRAEHCIPVPLEKFAKRPPPRAAQPPKKPAEASTFSLIPRPADRQPAREDILGPQPE
jgi:hypothetical protein